MTLQRIANRIALLKANTPVQAGLITFTTGALFSAFEAQKSGFTDRSAHPRRWQAELNDARLAAADMAKGRRPSKITWVCIPHFNSALIRIDVGFERLVRHVTGSNSRNMETLVKAAKSKRLPGKALRQWQRVRCQEVNKLKHRNPSSLVRYRMKYAEMIKALDDLVSLLTFILK